MTLTMVIALNLGFSILAMLVVAGCTFLAHRLPDKPTLDADWHDWGNPLPVALVAHDAACGDQVSPYAAAA